MDNQPQGYDALPEDLKQKLQVWEKNSYNNRQLEALQGVAQALQTVAIAFNGADGRNKQTVEGLNKLVSDMKLASANLKGIKIPESPDYATPIVNALEKLEGEISTQLKAIDVKPQFKPNVSVAAPQVQVSAPDVDTTRIERILKTDLPKAFDKAIKSIPQTDIPDTDFTPVVDLLTEMSNKLDSIETAARLKPQMPNTLKVTNPDGTNIATASVTVDSELPAAAALTDAAANPTTPLIGAAMQSFNGTTWDRVRSGDASDASSGTASLRALNWLYNGSTYDKARSGAQSNVTAATGLQSILPTAQYNATPPTITDTRYNHLQQDVNANLRVTLATALDKAVDSIASAAYGHSYVNISTATTTTIKSGSGVIAEIRVLGGTLGNVTVYDNTTGTGTTIIPTVTPVANQVLIANAAFSTGLTIVTAAATIIVVTYR